MMTPFLQTSPEPYVQSCVFGPNVKTLSGRKGFKGDKEDKDMRMCCVSIKQRTKMRKVEGEKDEKESSTCFIQARGGAREKKRAASCAGDEKHGDKE